MGGGGAEVFGLCVCVCLSLEGVARPDMSLTNVLRMGHALL